MRQAFAGFLNPSPKLEGSWERLATSEYERPLGREGNVSSNLVSCFTPEKLVSRSGAVFFFEVDALHCPACGGQTRILSAITEPGVARRILECLDMQSRDPPLGERKGGPAELPREESAPSLPWDDEAGFDFDPSRLDDS